MSQGFVVNPPSQQYPGGTPQAQYPREAPLGAYSGGPPPQGGYPGGPPPQGGYPGGPPAQGGYPGGHPAQGGYPGGPPPQTGYPGGPPQQGGYPGGGPPQGGYPPHGGAGQPPQQGDAPMPQWKGEIPDQDVDDNPNAAATAPSAPPLEKMDEVAGYSNIGFDGAMAPPPSYEAATREPPQRAEIQGLPQIDETEARNALLQHVSEHCCYGSGAAQSLRFTDLQHSSAFHYTLETFGEARSTAWAYDPYSGQPIDGPQNGPAPGPWDIQAAPPATFQNQQSHIEVPHTASVKPCHNCMAMGRVRCHRCFGRGRVRCTSCAGRGHKTVYRNGEHEHERCHWCHGDGRRRCCTCHGFGMVTCACCQGHCSLKCYIKLTITWTNHLTDHIVERTALPDHLIRNVAGRVAFTETQQRVWPINHFPDAEINNASNRLVNQHATAFPSERLLMQRHQVRIVPVTQAMYKWKDTNSDYFVYGFEKKVYAPNYPQQCCCGCTVL
ncbi:protein SSUH2 homolog isoform X2 [Mya arenaria]|nr:protein SSUH2 homolog isoform X2 [Mya arenaria]XP_052781227.1 protein SSUH2 homolog isoform X2 [Mya arenaria]XP_052781228.1 protein SSUH2 homolog isoform X2 [Mya arenaria]